MRAFTSSSNSDAYQSFIDAKNAELQQLSPEPNVTFDSDVWAFKNRRYTTIADFGYFHKPYTKFIQRVTLEFNGGKFYLNTAQLAKVIWLSLMEGKATTANVPRVLECIVLLFSYLKDKGVNCLSADDIEGLYALMLNNDPSDNALVSRYYAPAFVSRVGQFNVNNLLRLLKCYGCTDLLLPTIQLNNYTKALNGACQSVMGITLSDYKKGGTFDFLGLDTGRHYIDFCSEIFEAHVVYATACRLTYSKILEDVREHHITYKCNYTIKRICAETLMGVTLDDVEDDFVQKMQVLPKELVRKRTLELFCKYYNDLVQQASAFKLEIINAIVIKLGLPEVRFDNQEFVRAMLFTLYNGEKGKSRKHILLEFKSSLSAMNIQVEWDLATFDSIVESVNQFSLLTCEDSFVLCKKHYDLCAKLRVYDAGILLAGASKLKHALMGIESAGTTLFVAMTGWRASEFGFPLSSIKVEVNQDILDSTYTPYRFFVNWVVPKTSSTTPLDREITLAGYVLAAQLAQLNQAKSEDPCLYALTTITKYPGESKNSIDKRVEALWQGFSGQYSVFVELDELELLQKRATRSIEETIRQAYLCSRYNLKDPQIQELQSLRDRLRKGLPRYILTKGASKLSFKNQLLQYQYGALSPEKRVLFDLYLSDETKYALKQRLIKLIPTTIRSIRAEFLEGEPYPTTHALRHMWAEAVLRRYRGDVGKFIRANFKHLNENFFMAYLRGKEFRLVYKIAERNVINSVVRHHLLAQKHNQREYAGGFDNYLSKVVNLTKILSNEEYIKTANTISKDRVVAIKANAWGTCLLRVGTNQRAKCAQDGIPQRHNASPKLCLGCINADVSKGNFNGIVVYTRPEVEACRNPDLPAFIKINCIEVLKPALTQVKKLRKNSGQHKYDKFIAHLEESIEMAKKTVLEEK